MFERIARPQEGAFIRWRVRDGSDPQLMLGLVRWVRGDMLCIEAMDWCGVYFWVDLEMWLVPPAPQRPTLWDRLRARFKLTADAA